MIKALILDIDGILLGHKDELNFPLPTQEVQSRLQILAKRMPISLCTVKAYFAVEPIIRACGLENNYHITDAGATIVHGKTGQMQTSLIDSDSAKQIVEDLRRVQIYTEWYADDNYFALEHDNTLILDSRTKLLGRQATIVSQATQKNISKIIALPLNEWQTTSLIEISRNYEKVAALHWGINPSLIPKMAAFYTNPDATKRTGVEKITSLNKVLLSETLAMGDSSNDWTFMELCGYVGTIGNGSPELKELVAGRMENGKISEKTVDENGVLEVLNQFGLTK